MSDELMEAEWLLEADWGTAEVRRPPRRTYSFLLRRWLLAVRPLLPVEESARAEAARQYF